MRHHDAPVDAIPVDRMTSPGGATLGRAAPRAILAGGVALATAIVIIGLSVALFLNPWWVSFAQDRAGVPAITGYTLQQVQGVTGAILADLLVGPPEFDVAIDGRPVLDNRERAHMVDVRNVLLPATILFGAAAAVLAVAVKRNRRSAWLWRAIGHGATILVVLGVAVGVASLLFFDAVFLLFHLVVFPQGNFSFDPRTQRLTQLFPEQLWTETSLAIAAVGLTMAAVVSLLARRRAARLADRPGPGSG